MKIIECDQLSPEWWEARRGLPTASRFSSIFAAKSARPSESIDRYIAELLADRECQTPPYFTSAGKPSTPGMRRGQDLEPEARRWYEGQVGRRTWRPGFITTDDGRFGCSPDAMVGLDWGAEIKIYDPALHAKWVKAGEVPAQFLAQLHGSLFVTGLPRWDLVLWQPDQPGLVIEVRPNETTALLTCALEEFHHRYESAKKVGLKLEARSA